MTRLYRVTYKQWMHGVLSPTQREIFVQVPQDGATPQKVVAALREHKPEPVEVVSVFEEGWLLNPTEDR